MPLLASRSGVRQSFCVAKLAIIIVLFLGYTTRPLAAQSGAGSIQGTVSDTTEAVIAGATVTAVETRTGVTYSTKSNNAGFYVLPGLFTGTYTLKFTQEGYKTLEQTLLLQVSQTAVADVRLPAGAVEAKVEVSGTDIQLVNTESGELSSVLENERINQLPMDGRQLITLVGNTTPGVEGGQRANGNLAEALEYVQDGVPTMNRNFGSVSSSNYGQFPDPDAVQQVRIVSAAANAQYSTPGTVVVTTKQGTNAIHGSGFETARNNGFGLAKGRNFGATGLVQKYVRNEFGINVGGPIRIPHVYNGRDKSFFSSHSSGTPCGPRRPRPSL